MTFHVIDDLAPGGFLFGLLAERQGIRPFTLNQFTKGAEFVLGSRGGDGVGDSVLAGRELNPERGRFSLTDPVDELNGFAAASRCPCGRRLARLSEGALDLMSQDFAADERAKSDYKKQ